MRNDKNRQTDRHAHTHTHTHARTYTQTDIQIDMPTWRRKSKRIPSMVYVQKMRMDGRDVRFPAANATMSVTEVMVMLTPALKQQQYATSQEGEEGGCV